MKTIIILCIATLGAVASANAGEPVHVFDTILKDHVAVIKAEENLASHVTVYRAYLCDQGDCEMFESAADGAASLADFAYLFAVSHQGDGYVNAKQWTAPAGQADAAADAILKRDNKTYGCDASQVAAQQMCVLHALFKAGNLKRYYTKQGDAETIEQVDEDGKYIPGGYD